MREKPLVVVCTDDHRDRYGITANQRRNECRQAMKILGCDLLFLGIPEMSFDRDIFSEKLGHLISLIRVDELYIPAEQGGHEHHDLIGRVYSKEIIKWCLFKVTKYATYTKENLTPAGDIEIIPTQEEIDLKNKALDCYKSQFPWNQPHFDAVRGKSEYYVNA